MVDLNEYYKKLAARESVSEAELVAVLKELERLRTGVAWLASCQAATLEGLPKSTSKSQRDRHVSICRTAASVLSGDSSGIKYPQSMESARDRCARAAGIEG